MLKSLLVLLFSTMFFLSMNAASLDASKALTQVDNYRGYQERFQLNVKITDYRENNKEAEASLYVYVKDPSTSYARYTSPLTDKNKMLLSIDDDVWFYNQGKISKPLRLSSRQRLLGNVSNGDIARANFSGDYTPEMGGMATIEGTHCLLLRLTAKTPQVTYGKIELYVLPNTFKPVLGYFYATSGKLLKTGQYTKFASVNGSLKVSEMVIADAVMTQNKSILEYSGYQKKDIPDYYFNLDYLPRLH